MQNQPYTGNNNHELQNGLTLNPTHTKMIHLAISLRAVYGKSFVDLWLRNEKLSSQYLFKLTTHSVTQESSTPHFLKNRCKLKIIFIWLRFILISKHWNFITKRNFEISFMALIFFFGEFKVGKSPTPVMSNKKHC